MKKSIDLKGLFWFLFITFGLTIGLVSWLCKNNYSLINEISPVVTLSLLGAMFIPAIAALIVRTLITKEGFKDAGLKWGKWKYYGQTWLTILGIYVAAFGLTTLFVGRPDFTLVTFIKQFGMELPIPAYQMILAITFSTLFIAPIINMIPSFGEEFGWRGYLLPKLLTLGQKKALIVHGIIWGLWHAPFVLFLGFAYGDLSIFGAILFTLLITLIGIYFGWLRIISGSVWLATFAHAVFNAHSYGIWRLLYPDINPYLGGIAGLTGLVVLFLVAAYILKYKIKP